MNREVLGAFADYQRAADLAETTIRNRNSMLRTLAKSLQKPLLDATTADLRRHVGRDGISAASRRTERNAFRAFYAFALGDGLIDDNPADRLPVVRVPRRTPRPFTPEQIDTMLRSGAYARTRAMILLGYYQGFRVSSIARVHGHDIDPQSMRIRVLVKGGKEGILPLHPMIAELARVMPAHDWWFPARGRDGHIRPASVTERVQEARDRAGIRDPRLTAHSLRHSFGTHLLDAGVDIRVIQELMMHEDLSSTQLYTSVSEQRKQEGIGALDRIAVPVASGRGRAA